MTSTDLALSGNCLSGGLTGFIFPLHGSKDTHLLDGDSGQCSFHNQNQHLLGAATQGAVLAWSLEPSLRLP